jgi:hypothetical protein
MKLMGDFSEPIMEPYRLHFLLPEKETNRQITKIIYRKRVNNIAKKVDYEGR